MQETDMIEEVEDELEHRKVGGICADGDLGHESDDMQPDKAGMRFGVVPQGQGQILDCKEGSVDVKKKEKKTSSEGAEGKLTVEEDRIEGVVTWATYIQYAKDGGGYESPLHLVHYL